MSSPNEEIFYRLMAAGKIKIQQGRLFNAALTPKPADFDFAKVEDLRLVLRPILEIRSTSETNIRTKIGQKLLKKAQLTDSTGP